MGHSAQHRLFVGLVCGIYIVQEVLEAADSVGVKVTVGAWIGVRVGVEVIEAAVLAQGMGHRCMPGYLEAAVSQLFDLCIELKR